MITYLLKYYTNHNSSIVDITQVTL